MSAHRGFLVSILALVLACGPSSATPDGGTIEGGIVDAATDADAATPLPTGKFRIAMWCGPPGDLLSQGSVDTAAKAGFTTVSNGCDGTTSAAYDKELLQFAEQAGLDAIVSDSRLGDALAGTNVAANLDAVVADYGSSKALAGYFIGDEPSKPAFANIATIVADLATRDANHFAYTNLLPDYASTGQLGTTTYDDYVSSFLATVKPQIVSWDYYPFLTGGTDMSTFFADMSVVRAHAVATHTPFFQFIQAISYNGHRATTQAEKLWVGTETLAYGGAGVSYFTYWTPPQTSESFGNGIIDLTGNPTSQYAEATAINAELSAFGKYLVAATSTSVFYNGPLASGTEPRVPGMPAYVASAAPITVGLFAVNTNDVYVFLANHDYVNPAESDVYFANNPESLDVTSGAFKPLATLGTTTNGVKTHLVIPPADGVLVHLAGPVPPGAPGAEAYVGTVRSDAGTYDVVDSSFGDAHISGASWDTCKTGYTFAGHDFQSNGFWLCARSDLIGHTFYFGNVVADAGTIYAVSGGTATSQGAGGWNTCPKGTLLGRRFESNGFWLCLD